MQSLCFAYGCGRITCNFTFSLSSLSDRECYPFVHAPPPWWKFPTRAMASCCLNLIWLIGMQLFFLQLSTQDVYLYYRNLHTPRKILLVPISVSSEGSSMLPCTDLQYPFCPSSPCNLQLQLASPQLLFSPSYAPPDRLWHVCVPSAEQCHSMPATGCFHHSCMVPFLSFGFFMTAGTSFLLFMTVTVRWNLTLLSSLQV